MRYRLQFWLPGTVPPLRTKGFLDALMWLFSLWAVNGLTGNWLTANHSNNLTIQYISATLGSVINPHSNPFRWHRLQCGPPPLTPKLPSNPCVCHTSRKPVPNSFVCHTSKNTALKVLYLPHMRETGGWGSLILLHRSHHAVILSVAKDHGLHPTSSTIDLRRMSTEPKESSSPHSIDNFSQPLYRSSPSIHRRTTPMNGFRNPLLRVFLIALLFALVFSSKTFAQISGAAVGIFEHHEDVGTVLHAGTTDYDPTTKTYALSASGENMWARTDAFQFAWKKVSGDVSLAADISFIGAGSNPHRKAVLMIRQSLDADSVYADIALHGVGMTALQYRDEKGAVTREVMANISMQKRLKLEKHG